MEPTVAVAFTQSDLSALAALLDAAVKATGVPGAKAAIPLIEKVEVAVAAFNQTKEDQQ